MAKLGSGLGDHMVGATVVGNNTTEILWCSSQRRVDQLPSLPFLICGSSVGPSSVVRDLGVWIDNGLTMSTHVTKVVASLRQLRSVRRSLSHESFTRLMVALVLARLDYCYGVRRYDHVTPLLQQLHWLSVPERVTFKLCVMVYRCLHGIGPEYFSEARVRDSISPVTALGLQYRRRSSCHTPVFTWRPSIPSRRERMERTAGQCHRRTIFVLIPETPEDISFPATTDNCVNNTNYCHTVSWS